MPNLAPSPFQRVIKRYSLEDLITHSFVLGWFGRNGLSREQQRHPRVHIVRRSDKRPLCGIALGVQQKYQWASDGVVLTHVECTRCRNYFPLVEKKLQQAADIIANI